MLHLVCAEQTIDNAFEPSSKSILQSVVDLLVEQEVLLSPVGNVLTSPEPLGLPVITTTWVDAKASGACLLLCRQFQLRPKLPNF